MTFLPMSQVRQLQLFLRVSGFVLLLAAPAALLPEHWMDQCHLWLLGEPLPTGRIIPYLTRSLSGMYASLGAITWFLATDVRRFAPVAAFKSAIGIGFGVTILAIDLHSAMPLYWTLAEGPGIICICGVGLYLSRKVMKSETE